MCVDFFKAYEETDVNRQHPDFEDDSSMKKSAKVDFAAG